jgi:hypothetical protein
MSAAREVSAPATTPDAIKNDPKTLALMASWTVSRATDSPRTILFAVQDPAWRERMEGARWMDAFAVANYGQHDRCFHFCCEQRYQHRDGLRMYEVGTNMFGYCVRDTMNDGDGVVFGGRARKGTMWQEAVDWARNWHAEKPTHREVIRGFCWDDERKCEVFPELRS